MKKIIIKPKDLYNISPLLKGVMDLAFDASCIMDKDGVIINCSASSELIWNRPNEESIGRHITELDSASPYPELLETGKAVMGKIHIINGRTCITHMIPLFDRKGEILGAFGVIIFCGVEKLKNLVRENIFDDQSMSIYHQLSRTEASNTFSSIQTRNARMFRLIEYAKKAAQSDYPILICGETGTGKELFANAIHSYATESGKKPFIRINCSAIPAEHMEAELFGYERGAFPGAASTKRGKFEIAINGTILLDEIGSLNTYMQSKLLRVIEAREFERVGGNTLIPLRARIIATTNYDVKKMVQDNRLRKDLYYRLSVLELNIPPLREHAEDVELLTQKFLTELNVNCTVDPEAMVWLKKYSWPGNVRQLRNLITRLCVMEDDNNITLDMIRNQLSVELGSESFEPLNAGQSVEETREYLEKSLLITALEDTKYNISATAKMLNLSRNTVYSRIKKYGIIINNKNE